MFAQEFHEAKDNIQMIRSDFNQGTVTMFSKISLVNFGYFIIISVIIKSYLKSE